MYGIGRCNRVTCTSIQTKCQMMIDIYMREDAQSKEQSKQSATQRAKKKKKRGERIASRSMANKRQLNYDCLMKRLGQLLGQ